MKEKLIRVSFFSIKVLLIVGAIAGILMYQSWNNCSPPPKPTPNPTPQAEPTPPTLSWDFNAEGISKEVVQRVITDMTHAEASKIDSDARPVTGGEATVGRIDVTEEGYGDRISGTSVNLDQFFLSSTEVTVSLYKVFVDSKTGGYAESAFNTKKWWTEEGWKWKTSNSIVEPLDWSKQQRCQDCPVTGVSFYEAEAFCRFLSGGGDLKPEDMLVRLPNEFEWEKAARSGFSNPNDFPWGDKLDSIKEYANVSGSLKPVKEGVKPTNDGIYYNLIGNVSEWTTTIYGQAVPPGGSEALDAHLRGDGAGIGTARVCKGSSFAQAVDFGHEISARLPLDPGTRSKYVGFRLATDSIEKLKKLCQIYAPSGQPEFDLCKSK